jgi:dTDP-4-dehydrorhamnose 3,5-epimerase
MKISNRSKIEDVKIFALNKYLDDRGSVTATCDNEIISDAMNSVVSLNYGHETYSKKDVLRGIHYQVNKPQNRLVRVTYGAVFDIALDLRKSSPTFGKWQAELLSSEKSAAMWIPAGVAHGYLVISEFAIINIHSDAKYEAELQRVIRWNDRDLAIDWPLYANYPIIIPPVLSERDGNGLNFMDAEYFL